MQITVQLPDDLTQHPNPGREALEALVIEGYRTGTFTHHEGAQLLGLQRFAFEAFLKEREVYEFSYSVEDLEKDLATLDKLHAKGLLPG